MSDKKPLVIGLAVAACVAVGGFFLCQKPRGPAPAEGMAAAPAGVPGAQPMVIPAPAAVDLTDSDGMFREKAKGLSGLPQFAQWLKTEDLLRRLTAAVFCVADGTSPSESLSFLSPRKKFAVKKAGGRLVIDPKSYARYDGVAAVVGSIDARAAASLIQSLGPWFQAASGELGAPPRDFHATLLKAIGSLLQTPVVERDIPLKEKVISFSIAPMPDLQLEELTAAQKHLLRMGPKNTAMVQAKLRELALALGAPAQSLPQQRIYTAK
ncbi:MAG: DUF3014 domain-containing protein [Elusimicrobia bacterium]|nr:DUF3014 domain-containing protein [Elusimicrobiota bacterium]